MQIKHAFLFTLILGLLWTGYVFAYQFGPDPAMNGIAGSGQTCATAGCHTSFRLNDPSGSVSVSGLPTAGWVAGQTYPLTVTIQRTGQRGFGFQLSAVADGTNRQAGTLASSGTVQVICGSLASLLLSCSNAAAIQFAEHRTPRSGSGTGTFTVNWTAPADASLGTIRINVAGNAADLDQTNQGDYIFTKAYLVLPAAAPPPPDLSTHAFTMVDRGGSSIITDGSGDVTLQGFARIQASSGTTPSGVAIFEYRKNNLLVSATGVPATRKVTAGRIYAEISSTATTTLNTGLAIANPNDTPANISFFFTDASGSAAGSGTKQISPNGQVAQFLNEAPFNVYPGTTFQGTFSFTSDVVVGVVALRGLTNERGEFLMSTLPVIDTTVPPSSGTVVVPHFADGSGWTTQILLVNPTDSAMTGNVQFTDTSGAATNVTIAGRTSNSFPYSIPGRTSQKLATAGTTPGPMTGQGSVRVVPASGGAAPTPLVVFSYKPGNVTQSEAGVPVSSGTAFRMYVETGPGMDSGVAVANTSSSPVNGTFDITDLNGAATGIPPVPISLPASGQTAKFLSGIFPSLPNPFKGVLRVTTNSSVSIVGLRTRYNERQPTPDFLITTTPPTNEASAASSAEFLFPHIANGGGYTTQFILFSGIAGQLSSGNLRFFTQGGAAFNLNVN